MLCLADNLIKASSECHFVWIVFGVYLAINTTRSVSTLGKRYMAIFESEHEKAFGSDYMIPCEPMFAAKRDETNHPTAASLDSQSVKAKALAGEKIYDADNKIQARKHHILVDTMGLLLIVMVIAASIQDRDGAKLVLQRLNR